MRRPNAPPTAWAAAALVGAWLLGCVGRTGLEGRPCPCADGWVCCASEGVCMPDSASCGPSGGCAALTQGTAGLEGPPGHASCADGDDNDCDGAADDADPSCRNIAIYRSVGFGRTTALATGAANAMTVTGSTAAFAQPLPLDVGAGDVLQYDSDGDGAVDAAAFVYGRLAESTLLLANAQGGEPQPLSSPPERWSIFRAYVSLAAAEDGNENDAIAAAVRDFDAWSGGRDLVANGEAWTLFVYADGVDALPLVIDGWTLSGAGGNCLEITAPHAAYDVGTSQRHVGRWDPSRAAISADASHGAITVRDSCVRLRGLQIEQRRVSGIGAGVYFEDVADLDLTVSHCIIRGPGAASDTYAGGIAGFAGAAVRAYANVVYDFRRGIVAAYLAAGATVALYGNTVADVADIGIFVEHFSRPQLTYRIKNNLVQDSGGSGFVLGGAETLELGGNLSSDASSPDSALRGMRAAFRDRSGDDFHLDAADVVARDAGVALSDDDALSVAVDIDGEPRQEPWDIGADEIARQR